jgi:ribosome-binding factor A
MLVFRDESARSSDVWPGSVGVEGGGAASPPLGGGAGDYRPGVHPKRATTRAASRLNSPMTERMRRVNESLRHVLATALPELKDPRLGLITVTGVDTAPDLRHATVYVSVLGSRRKQRASLLGLEAAHGVLQSRLARDLRLKRTPQLTFEYDPTVERGVRMTRLIDELAPDDDDADD